MKRTKDRTPRNINIKKQRKTCLGNSEEIWYLEAKTFKEEIINGVKFGNAIKQNVKKLFQFLIFLLNFFVAQNFEITGIHYFFKNNTLLAVKIG